MYKRKGFLLYFPNTRVFVLFVMIPIDIANFLSFDIGTFIGVEIRTYSPSVSLSLRELATANERTRGRETKTLG